jgi:hypothetical protein
VGHTTVYASTADANPDDVAEPALPAGMAGPVMVPEVGPFATGAYRLTATLDEGGPGEITSFSCIDIVESH